MRRACPRIRRANSAGSGLFDCRIEGYRLVESHRQRDPRLPTKTQQARYVSFENHDLIGTIGDIPEAEFTGGVDKITYRDDCLAQRRSFGTTQVENARGGFALDYRAKACCRVPRMQKAP